MPPPPLKSWEGHVSPPSADPRWHVINSKKSDIGRVTCAPPSQTMGGARAPLPIPAFNPLRDVSQAGPPVPVSARFSHFLIFGTKKVGKIVGETCKQFQW